MQSLWLVGAKTVDPQEGVARDANFGFDGARIIAHGPAPRDAETLDASGLFLTPGLIDAHVHLGLSSPIKAQFTFQLSPAQIAADIFISAAATLDAGFTTVRDAGGIDGGVVDVIASGKVRGPGSSVAGRSTASSVDTATTVRDGSPTTSGRPTTSLGSARYR